MTNRINAQVECQLVGEYVDDGERPANPTCHPGEVVRPHVVADYVELCTRDDGIKEFTVLFKDGRLVVVRGHGLKHSPHPVAGQDVYSIVMRSRGEEVLVALVKSEDVAAIFHGEIRSDRKIA